MRVMKKGNWPSLYSKDQHHQAQTYVGQLRLWLRIYYWKLKGYGTSTFNFTRTYIHFLHFEKAWERHILLLLTCGLSCVFLKHNVHKCVTLVFHIMFLGNLATYCLLHVLTSLPIVSPVMTGNGNADALELAPWISSFWMATSWLLRMCTTFLTSPTCS